MSDFIVRASSSGKIMTNKKGAGITDLQLSELNRLIEKKRESSLTPKQEITLKEFTKKKDAPIELSDTCKSELVSSFLHNKKGVEKFIYSKFLDKGNYIEAGIADFLSKLDGVYYPLNQERVYKGYLTGECDIITKHSKGEFNGLKVVDDIKASWDAFTFMEAGFSKDYEWQGRCYMDLYNADVFRLRYCLFDCPEHIYQGELYKLKMKENMIDESTEENSFKVDQLRRSLVFSENENFQDLDERVKTYTIHRDDEKFKELLDRIPACKEFYDGLRLNKKWRKNE